VAYLARNNYEFLHRTTPFLVLLASGTTVSFVMLLYSLSSQLGCPIAQHGGSMVA
jgi:hypothetical protein